ncbi:MAG: hypothetical protein IPG90_21130 [Bacteroidetes bacterium]|nr:hypothetical protein [Bacteroidota bacterium]
MWTGSLNGLPTGLVEQLQSTNMEFIQHDDKLCIIGGYGTANSSRPYYISKSDSC